MARARVRLTGERKNLDSLLRSDWEKIIHEANLGTENTRIAELYLLDAIPQVEIGAEVGLHRTTVTKRLPTILEKIERTSRELGFV